ncbi:alpha/beta hydrolase [Leptolyngbya subtilissima]
MSWHQWRKFWLGSGVTRFKKRSGPWTSLISRCGQLFGIGCLSTLLYPATTVAAEQVSLFYGPFEFSISVSSLERFAREGTVDSELAAYAKHAKPEEIAEFRQILSYRLNLGVVPVSQFLYSSFGEISLRFLGNLIQTEAHQNGFYALRASLILAAADPEGLTLLNVLKKFPTRTMRINSEFALEMVRGFTDLYHQTQQATTLIERQFDAEAKTEPAINPDLAPKLDQPGEWKWTQETLTLDDRRRQRRFVVDLYRPQRPDSVSTLIISPGLWASRSNFAELAQHLASHGFAVVVMDHPGSNRQQLEALLAGRAREVVRTSEFIDRPLDVSYLLDELQRRTQTPVSGQGTLNLQSVGIIGHSFGGYTALALAGATFDLASLRQECESSQINLNVGNISLLLQCSAIGLSPQAVNRLRDPRVQAVVALNPIGSQIFGPQGIGQLQVPVMLVSGSEDAIAPALLEQICPFTWLTTPNQYLVLIQKGSHTYASANTNQNDPFNAPELAGPDPALAYRYLNTMTLAFAKNHLAAAPVSASFLQASYVRSISQPPLPLKLVRSLDEPEVAQAMTQLCPRPTVAQNP